MLLILLILFAIAAQYVIDVRMGSSSYTYNSEVGLPNGCCRRLRLLNSDFLGKMLPFQLASIGLPLIFYNLTTGITLVILALVLFLWKSEYIPLS